MLLIIVDHSILLPYYQVPGMPYHTTVPYHAVLYRTVMLWHTAVPYLVRVVPQRGNEKLVPKRGAVRLVVHEADARVSANCMDGG